VGQQVVAEQHRLRVLQVRAPRHDRAVVRLGLTGQRVDEVEHAGGDHAGVVAQEGTEERRHLVVARAARAQAAAHVGTDLDEQQPLEGTVDVLVQLGARVGDVEVAHGQLADADPAGVKNASPLPS
jgi:hypothetical protein